MMMKTHIIIAKSLLDNTDKNKQFFLNDRNFIYGNIKPDIASKYKLKKHYLDESYDMIRKKINTLSSLNLDSLEKQYTKASFSQEDRKSTRLNSSHANISYAVFCLKKKKSISFVGFVTLYGVN